MEKETTRILVVEDSEGDYLLIQRHLRKYGLPTVCQRVDTLDALQTALLHDHWDIVLSDYSIPGLSFRESLACIQQREPHPPIILVSGSIGEETAVELLKQGVWDFVLKDRLARLVPAIERSLREAADQAARRQAEERIKRSEDNLKRAQAVAQMGSWQVDLMTGSVECSEEALRILGVPAVQPLSWKDLLQRVHRDDRATVDAAWSASLQGAPYDIEHRIVTNHGKVVWAHTKAEVRYRPDGVPVATIGTIQDITRRKETEERLKLSSAAFENIAEAVMVTDRNRRIVSVNRAFGDITGYTAEHVLGSSPSMLCVHAHQGAIWKTMWRSLRRHGTWQGELSLQRRSSEVYPAWLKMSVVQDPMVGVTHFVGVFSDVSEQKKAQARIRHLAHHDPLTGLANRNLLADRLHQAILQARRAGTQVAVVFLDLDGFKAINDSLGHPAGDRLLCDVARRLQQCLRESDTVSRLSGDEFIVVLSGMRSMDGVQRVVGSIRAAMTPLFEVRDHQLEITLSMGISIYPRDGQDVSTLLTNADNAMYAAKAAGRDTYRFFSAELDAQARERFQMEMDLRSALRLGEFHVYYQPKVESRSGCINGAEALLRWEHPQYGLLTPDAFLDVAEDTGLIVPIGEWVLRQACRQCRHWHDAGYPLSVAVNLSPRQIRLDGLIDMVSRVLDETGLDGRYLELELTERLLVEPTERTLTTLRALQSLGICIAVDDFGTGYSSLSYLKRLPINTLKIAKPFVDDVAVREDDRAIAEAVVALARAMRLATVAEGVENASQERVLREIGCDAIQGYFFSRAVPAPELLRLHETQHTRAPAD